MRLQELIVLKKKYQHKHTKSTAPVERVPGPAFHLFLYDAACMCQRLGNAYYCCFVHEGLEDSDMHVKTHLYCTCPMLAN